MIISMLTVALLSAAAAHASPRMVSDARFQAALEDIREQSVPRMRRVVDDGKAGAGDILQRRLKAAAARGISSSVSIIDYNEKKEVAGSYGSGVILSESGLIITNNHVASKMSSPWVVLGDNRRIKASVVGLDPESDLALIKVSTHGLSPEAWRPAVWHQGALETGDFVIAVGSPWQLSATVTWGIVSAVNRGGLELNAVGNFIQHSAPINPGNSGGGLFLLRLETDDKGENGELVGINSAMFSDTKANSGVGMAIPASVALDVAHDLAAHGKITRRGGLGIDVSDIGFEEQMRLGVYGGVRIGSVKDGKSGAAAGLEPGDIITAIGDIPVERASHFRSIVLGMRPNTTVSITIKRGGAIKIVPVVVGSRKPLNGH
ncbi:MAG: trypsin-like peptidase domain-containing protein [Elusimicrobiota bacterium]